MGGHSLKIMSLINMIQQELEVEVPLEVVFNDATISVIAQYIREHASQDFQFISKAPEQEYYRLSSQQLGLFMTEQLRDCKTGNNIASIMGVSQDLCKPSN